MDLPGIDTQEYNDSNALALPGRKRKKKAEDEDSKPKVRKLTKKERKRLEKIKTVKEKKAKVSECAAMTTHRSAHFSSDQPGSCALHCCFGVEGGGVDRSGEDTRLLGLRGLD